MRTPRGFTLLEVMVGLALLGLALVTLIKSSANSILTAQRAQTIGVATDLARGKMYDIEEKLLKDGFTDTDQSEEGKTFADEGWPQIGYSYKVEQVEMPSWDDLQQLSKGHAAKQLSGSGSGSANAALKAGSGSGSSSFSSLGSDDSGGFQNSALGGMMTMFGGGFGGSGASDAASGKGAGLVQMYYGMFQQILKVAIRKVSLTVTWRLANVDDSFKTVTFFTDQSAMDKVLMGMGSTELPDDGSGSGSGSGKTPPKTPTPPVTKP
jgi:general secretion pathway protein I